MGRQGNRATYFAPNGSTAPPTLPSPLKEGGGKWDGKIFRETNFLSARSRGTLRQRTRFAASLRLVVGASVRDDRLDIPNVPISSRKRLHGKIFRETNILSTLPPPIEEGGGKWGGKIFRETNFLSARSRVPLRQRPQFARRFALDVRSSERDDDLRGRIRKFHRNFLCP